MNVTKLGDANLLVFGAPQDKFSMSEVRYYLPIGKSFGHSNKADNMKMKKFGALKNYLENGGSILYLSGEGGEAAYPTNFNYLLEEFGMSVNPGRRASLKFQNYVIH